jgi:hypothetical protein
MVLAAKKLGSSIAMVCLLQMVDANHQGAEIGLPILYQQHRVRESLLLSMLYNW